MATKELEDLSKEELEERVTIHKRKIIELHFKGIGPICGPQQFFLLSNLLAKTLHLYENRLRAHQDDKR